MPPKIKSEISIHQTFLDDRHPPIALLAINECKLNRSHINWVLQPATSATSASTPETKVIGMHPAFTEAGLLSALAISVSSKVLLITDVMKLRAAGQRGTRSGNSTTDGRDYLQSTVLNDSAYLITAFDAHQLVLGLHSAMGLTCTRVVDLRSLRPGDRDVVRTVQLALGARVELLGNLLLEAFQDNVYRDKEQQAIVAQKAWLASLIGDHPNARAEIARISPIDSSAFSKQELDILAQGMQALNILDSAKPTSRIIEHVDASLKGNKVTLNQTHYGDRLKESQNQILKIQGQDGIVLSADLSHVDGRTAKLKVPDLDGLLNTHVKSILVSGKAGPTLAEVKQAHIILLVLQRQVPLLSNPWFNRLFPSAATEKQCHPPNTDLATALNPIDLSNNVDANHEWKQIEDGPWSSSAPAFDSANAPSETKYDSQAISTNEWSKTPAGSWSSLPEDLTGSEAVVHSSSWVHIPLDDPWSTGNISHPPESDALPNSQISFKGDLNPTQTHAVQDMLDSRKDISVIQGPPGTGKTTVIAAYTANLLSDPKATLWIIAQSNVAVKNIGEKLVNADIHDWVLLVSDDFLKGWHEHLYQKIKANILPSSSFSSRKLACRVILCTMSMLSNRKIIAFSKSIVPMKTLVVDEASQIPMTAYMTVISQFGKNLKKISFIGDDKQLPPYASETSESLDSIFEKRPLLDGLEPVFLDIQYRMPPPIGNFLSSQIYSQKLQSWTEHPVQTPLCCQFIDIVDGKEEPEARSFKNTKEISVIVDLARFLAEKQKQFKILTPYVAQRDLLEYSMKENDLPWENTCFTVDSFQGNEGDYIIVSVVRTKFVGFLLDERRTNVMLSRAKKGMFICSTHSFLESHDAKGTLLGKMAEAWTAVEGGWITWDHQAFRDQIHI